MTMLKSLRSCQTTLTAPRLKGFMPLAAVLVLALIAAPGCSQQSSSSSGQAASSSASDPVLARVNGTEIRQSDLALAEDDLGNELQSAPPEVKREHLLSYVTDVILLAQAAEAKKFADTDEFKQRQAFNRNKLLMGLILQSQAKAALSDEAMEKVYEEAVKPMGAEEEVRARHILVDTEEAAKDIAAEIKNGGDFAALAKEKSKDPGSADGGDLGYFTKEQMVPEFSEVAFKMYPGQVSNPVKTQFGWHIIKVEDKRKRQVPPIEAVRDQIASYIARRAQGEFVSKLREGAKIERLDKAAAAPAAKPPEAAPKPPEPAPAEPMKK